MRIRQIDTENRRDVRKFIEFPNQLYRDNPCFCPALEPEIRLALDRKRHPFYRHSTADFFLAESEGQVLGRIAAVHNTLHNKYRQVRTAFFWAFDAVEDFSVAQGLFEAVFAWGRGRGRDKILGPRGLTGSDGAGVLVEGFDQRAVMGVPYNYPYYDKFITGMGFEKLTDHWSGYLPTTHRLSPRFFELAKKVRERRGFWIKEFESKEEMKAWVPRVLAVHETAFAGTHEWHPEPPGEMERVAEGLVAVADPRLVKLVLKDDKLIGFALAYPDLSDALRKCKGRLWPLGWWYLRQEMRRSKWLLANGIGVLPAYQNLGANVVLYTAAARALFEVGRFEHVDFVQVNETNFSSRADMDAIGVNWYKRHRSYTRTLEMAQSPGR